ncbi:recombinase [Vandammella animalimorsus]|uniref:Recombinase n=1 Tax=Vandammella animalimorsus TaxID=2029117 RepID=A0A2A2T6M8_9BURK|nr:recombinase [Vandammella animalimorsus]PAT32152.1 recombinase [Vandammella animalimorsus]PAX17171.1 recombinase [Vandammella animalimorsus]PAX19144.1 recombinase [Vandammella animalimorsus]
MSQPDLTPFAGCADFQSALQLLVQHLRSNAEQAGDALRDFLDALQEQPEINEHVASLFHQWLQHSRLATGFVQTGIYSRQDFGRELRRRLYDRINPPPRQPDVLEDVLQTVLRPSDLDWLNSIAPRLWLRLYEQLGSAQQREASQHYVRDQLLRAAEMLALWVAGEDLNPDLIRLNPRLLEVDSAFLSLQREVQNLVEAERAGRELPDTAQLDVMLDQSREQVAHLRRLGNQSGASLSTAHLLERLGQSLDRLEGILTMLTSERSERSARAWLVQLGQIINSGLEQRSIREFVRNSASMLSKSISSSKSEHGEHYITTTGQEYWHMLRSAAGAGVLIALMALLKIEIGRWQLAPFWSTLLISLNYGIGFVIVHLLGFTIATKQPAMTAASIAESVQQGQNSRNLPKHLADLLISVHRSQSVAVLGNVCLAMLVAAGVAWLYQRHAGQALLTADEVAYQLKALKPVPALWYAAIAALWLFCAGIISGYYDNRADYVRLRERLAVHPALRWLGPARQQRFANYLHEHFGALHGNFYFGVLLGVTPYIGHLLHLPLDIRHIAFSSANLSYAASGAELGAKVFALGLLYVLLIGMVNLWLSFFLALRVALRARDTEIPSLGKLLQALFRQLRAGPMALLWPPAAPADAQRKQPPDSGH